MIGHAQGGYLALAYAARHNDRVADVALIDPSADDPAWLLPLNAAIRRRLTSKARATANRACSSGDDRACARATLPAFFFSPRAAARFGATFDLVPRNAVAYHALLADMGRRARLRSLAQRPLDALILYGAADPMRNDATLLGALLPRATRRTIPNAGNFVWYEQPKATESALLSFMERAGVSTPRRGNR